MSAQNSNKNNKFTFNAVDALIILVIIALIALILYVFVFDKDFSSCNTTQESADTSAYENTNSEESISAYIGDFNCYKGEVILNC